MNITDTPKYTKDTSVRENTACSVPPADNGESLADVSVNVHSTPMCHCVGVRV